MNVRLEDRLPREPIVWLREESMRSTQPIDPQEALDPHEAAALERVALPGCNKEGFVQKFFVPDAET